MSSMKAVVVRGAGGPDVLNVETMAVPTPKAGWVLIRVRAFGLNRSELFTVVSQSFRQSKKTLLLATLIQRVRRTARSQTAPIDQTDLSGSYARLQSRPG